MGLDFKETAQVVVDLSKCTGCGLCARVCPSETLAMVGGRPEVGKRSFMGCIGCGQCMAACPTDGIRVEGRRFHPNHVIAMPPTSAMASADAIEALLLKRRSVRRFTDREVDRATVDRILEMTATAPTGIPPTEVGVTVIQGRDKVSAFVDDMVGAFAKTGKMFNPLVLALMRPFIGRTQYDLMRDFVVPLMHMIVDRHKQGEDVFTYDAPLVMLFHGAPVGDPADTHIATTYAMLAAESLGLGTCWIGTGVVLNHFQALKTGLGVPKENQVAGMLILGYPSVKYQRALRRPLASVHFV